MDTFSLEESIVNEFSVQPYVFEPEIRQGNDFISYSYSEYSEEENLTYVTLSNTMLLFFQCISACAAFIRIILQEENLTFKLKYN